VDGVGYLPAFAPGSQEMDQARRVDVQLDLDSTGIDVHPAQGRLFEVAGQVSGGAPAELTLAGETGRQTITVSGDFRFNVVAPGGMKSTERLQSQPGFAPRGWPAPT